MREIVRKYRQHREGVLALLGLLAVSMIALPYLVLGEGSYVQVHDQLDGEVLNYIYRARYLGQGNLIPQFMNGMDKASMLPPAPLGVLLYRLLPPFAAYAVMHWLCLAVGFLGMYGLCLKLGVRAGASWAAACLFCYIPFYPTYGLAALGQPLLVLSGLGLAEGDARLQGKSAAGQGSGRTPGFLGCYLCIAFYGACSSLTLVGYVWIAVGVLWTLGLAVTGSRKKQGTAPALRVGGGVLVLSCVYLAANMDLLRTLTGKGFTTHRQEMVLRAAEHPAAVLGELLLSGGSYSPVYSAGILTAAVLLTLAVSVLWSRSRRRARQKGEGAEETGGEKAQYLDKNAFRVPEGKQADGREGALAESLRRVWALTGLIFCGAVLAVLWNCGPMVSLRLSLGGAVTYFQADRVYWCFPFLWMLVLGLVLESICRLGECLDSPVQSRHRNAGKHMKTGRARQSILPWVCCLLLLGVEGAQVLRDSTLNKNLRLMLFENYEQVTWESIYMDDVFARIQQAIGPEKEGYSVVSLGIHPSVALYHGYTCADGYSNNYDLAYKHRFRRIMAGELEKNEEARCYFDEWGNRLYLAGAPYGINGMVPKGQSGYIGLDYDLEAMNALHIRYLLAAAPVELSSVALEQTSLRLELVEGSPFTDSTAYYEVWVYRLENSREP